MSLAKPEYHDCTIVMIGAFNPAIIHPAWLARFELIPGGEAERAELEICHQEISKFSIGWARIEVLKNRFVVTTSQESSFSAVRDLSLGVLKLLSHTPISAMGLNRQIHCRAPSEQAWHAYGDKLAPKDLWSSVLEDPRPGLKSLTIQSRKSGAGVSEVNVQVAPSDKVQPGVFMSVNNHFNLPPETGIGDANRAIETIEKEWAPALTRSDRIFESLRTLET